MKRTNYLFAALAMLVIVWGIRSAHAQTLGKPAFGTFVVCETLDAAKKSMDAFRDNGRKDFELTFQSLGCTIVEGTGVVKKLVASYTIEGKSYHIVEVDFGDKTLYWLTAQTIKGYRGT